MLERLGRVTGDAGQSASNRSRAIRRAIEEHVLRLEREADEAREASIVKRHRRRLAQETRALVREQAQP